MDDNNNRDWSFKINLSGLRAPTGTANVEQGYYKAKVVDMYERPEKPGRVVIKLAITEGRFSGATRVTGINIPKSDEDNVRYYWRGFSESVGYDPAQLDAGEVDLSIESYKDRVAHIFYTPKEMTSNGYDEVDFLPPLEWSNRSADFAPAALSNEGSSKALGGGNTMKADDIRSRLGV
jgi:hypothetical protein